MSTLRKYFGEPKIGKFGWNVLTQSLPWAYGEGN